MPAPKKKEVGNDALLEAAGAEIPDPVPPTEVASLRTPEITTAQYIAAAFASVAPILTLVSVKLSQVQLDAVNDLKWIALGLLGSDALIRVGRSVGIGRRK